jgi:hypothetical protein
MRKPEAEKLALVASQPGDPMQPTSVTIHSYNNFVSTLKLVRKHRPFAENDNLPKIC